LGYKTVGISEQRTPMKGAAIFMPLDRVGRTPVMWDAGPVEPGK